MKLTSFSDRILPSHRLAIASLGFMATLVLYMNRVNMGIALVCMTEGSEDPNGNSSTNVTSAPGSVSIFHLRKATFFFINSNLVR